MKSKQLVVLNNEGGHKQNCLCKLHKRVVAAVSAIAMLFTSTTFLPNKTFNLVGEITASANSTLQKVANADSAWLEVGADFTYEINGTIYDCIVASSTQNEAVVIWKNVQNPNNDLFESKQSMILSCEEKGGRLIKFAEYHVLSEHGIIDTTNNYVSYGCKEYDVCDCIGGTWQWESSYNWNDWSYFIAFELKRNPIKTVSDTLVKTHADPTLSTAKGENFTWQGDCEIRLTYYDSDMVKLNDVPTSVGNYYVKASVPLVVVTETGEEIRYEASESNYITFKIKHNLMHTELKYQTCIEDGNYEYWKCSECKKYFSDEACTSETTLEKTVIEATGHNLQKIEEVKPTCTEDGNTKYWKCNDCGMYFSDANGENEIELSDTLITANGHHFTNYVPDENATCTEDGTKTAKCDNCDETKTIADENTANGHSFTNYVSNNDATCIKDGTKTATCDRCNETDTIADEKSATGHSFTKYVSDGNATCIKDGTKTAKCDNCNVTDAITDKATGHNLTHINRNEPTSTKKGNIEYWYCENCKKYFSDENGKIEIFLSETIIPMVTTTVTTKSTTTTTKATTKSITSTIKTTSKITTVTTKDTTKATSITTTVTTTTTKNEIPGDINVDGKTTVSDIVIMQQYLLKSKKLTAKQWRLADMNSDGKVNCFDLIILKRKILFN